jgi:hypothetical protein
MISGLSGATIWSEDVNNLLPFYRDTLGLMVGMETPGSVMAAERNGTGWAWARTVRSSDQP